MKKDNESFDGGGPLVLGVAPASSTKEDANSTEIGTEKKKATHKLISKAINSAMAIARVSSCRSSKSIDTISRLRMISKGGNKAIAAKHRAITSR